MSNTIRNLLIKVGADFSEAQKQFNKASKDFKKLGKNLTSIGKSLTTGITLPIAAIGAASVKLASDMDETVNKVDEVFEDNADEIKKWAETAIEKMGLASQTAMDTAALFGDMGKGMGLTTKEGLEMSMSLTQLSADMASFKNISQERVQTALAGVYTGETEALKSLGIVMTQANLKQFAMSKGIRKNIEDMTQAEKVQLRYAYVMEVSSDAQGDFVRTGGGAANQTRMLTEQLKQAGADIGRILLPTITDLLKSLNGMLKSFQALDPETKKTIVTIGLIAAAIGPVVTILGKFATVISTVQKGLGRVTKALAAGDGLLGAIKAFLGPAGSIVAVITAIAVAVGALVIAFNSATSESEKLRKEFEESEKVYKENAKQASNNATLARKLANELYDLQDKEKKTNAEKKRMEILVEQLNKLYPDLNLAIDKQTGLLNQNRQALQNLLSVKVQEIRLQQDAERLNELYNQQIKTQEDLTAATEKLAKAKEDLAASGERATLGEMDLMKKQSFLIGNMQAAQREVDNLNTLLSENAQAISNIEGAYSSSAEGIGNTNEQLVASNKETQDQINATNEQMLAAQEAYAAKMEEAERIHQQQMGTIWDYGIEKQKLTVKQATKNLNKQSEDFREWRKDLREIASKVPPEVLQYLEGLGPKAATLIDEMTRMSKEELYEFVKAYGTNASLAKQGFISGMDGITTESELIGTSTGVAMTTGMENTQSDVSDAAGDLKKQAVEGLRSESITTEFYSAGKSAGQGFANGILAKMATVKAAVKKIANAATVTIRVSLDSHSPSKVFEKIGLTVPQGFAGGIGSGINNVVQKAKLMATSAVGAVGDMSVSPFKIPTPIAAGGYSATPSFKESQQGGEIHMHVYVDGKEMGKATAPYVGQELQKVKVSYSRGMGI